MSVVDDLRQAALTKSVRFEVVEHEGKFYAVRQTNSRITEKVSEHKKPQARVVQMAIEVTCVATPVMNPSKEGEPPTQQMEDVEIPLFEPVLKDGDPVLETVDDPKGRPIVVDGKPYKRAKMQPVMKDGEQQMKIVRQPKFCLGPQVFDGTMFDTLMEEPTDEGSFLHKIALAAGRVNDRVVAKDRAKKS